MTPPGTSTASQHPASSVCSALYRACRDLRLYPPNHPMAQQSVNGFATALERYLQEWGFLRLEVQENSLLVDGDVVYEHQTGRDNLAFLLFRDGVRALSFDGGVEMDEIEALVDCLAHADDLSDMEQDIVTALWERDFGHVDYQAVDPFLAGEVLTEGTVDALRERVLQQLENTDPSVLTVGAPEPATLGVVQPVPIDSAGLQLTSQEIRAGEQAAEGLSSVLQEFAEVLLEISGDTGVHTAHEVVTPSLTGVVAALLEAGDIRGATFVLSTLEEMGGPGSSTAGLVAGGAVSIEHVRQLMRRLAQSPGDDAGDIELLIKTIKGAALPSLLEILAETDDRAIRRAVLGLLGGEGGVPWEELEPFLRDPRWYVVRNAVQLAAAAGHQQLLDQAPRLLRHPDVRVRREVIRALQRFSGRAVARGLVQGLSDQDSSVRTLAARAAGREGGPQVEELLAAHIGGHDFPSLPGEEVEAFFSAYAQVGQERAIPLLERSWKKHLLGSRPASFRAAAVLAIGYVRGPAAYAVLRQVSKSGDPQMKRAAAQAAQIRASLESGSVA